jgi:NIPSNAP
MKKILTYIICIYCLTASANNKPSKEYYQITIYHFATAQQEKVLDNYFQNALLPALHRYGYKNIGVFKSLANDTVTDKTIYVFMPLKSIDETIKLKTKLDKDSIYSKAGSEYLNAVYTSPPYTRMDVILTEAFPLAPKMELPKLKGPKNERVYELRSYESATEKIFDNKVKMFNEGDEIGLFKRLGFNAVFYSRVISGSKMPNLMYMTTFENKADRDAHWKNFSADPYWKKLSSMAEYQHNVSHIDIYFLRPVEYSDF